MPRFVVLEHVLPEGHKRPTHWDLMLEAEGTLATWALREPLASGETTPAQRLPDHRLAYLEYEGPISGDRGTVTRWDAGDYLPIAVEPQCWEVALTGRVLQGRLTLTQPGEGNDWMANFY